MKFDILEKLEEVSLERNSQGRLARYLIEKEDVTNLKIHDLMEECYISVATATRLAQKIGLKGFGELKVYLIEAKSYNKNIDKNQMTITTKTYSDSLSDSIITTFANLNELMLNKIVESIHASDVVDFYAVGGTNLIAQDFAFKLGRLNKHVTYYADYHMQYIRAKNSTKNTVAIAISYSGTTPEILKALSIAKENGAKTILITKDSADDLQFVDYSLVVETKKTDYQSYAIISRITILSILDLAFLKLIELDETYKDQIARTKFIK